MAKSVLNDVLDDVSNNVSNEKLAGNLTEKLNENLDEILNGIDAVIFDLDGTLVDSMWVWRQIDIDYLASLGYELPENLQHDLEGMSFSETAEYFKERFEISDEVDVIKAKWNDMAKLHYKTDICLKEGVEDFLACLYEKDIKMGIASSNSAELVSTAINTHKLDRYISKFCTSCEVNAGKPAPDVYLEVARRLGVSPERCLVFEDVPNGIRAGKNADMRTCAVYDDFSEDVDEIKRELADFYIRSYLELV